MSLLDNAKYQIKSITNTIKTAVNASLTSSTVSYGFIGISTAILGYYTFFENDIEEPPAEAETLGSEPNEPASSGSLFGSEPKESGSPIGSLFGSEPKEPASGLPASSGSPLGSIFGSAQNPAPEEPQKKVSFFGGKKKKIRFA